MKYRVEIEAMIPVRTYVEVEVTPKIDATQAQYIAIQRAGDSARWLPIGNSKPSQLCVAACSPLN